MLFIKFNNEKINLNEININDIYDLNIFVNNNFDYNISFNRDDKYKYIEKTSNYQLLLNNKLYKKKLDDIYIEKIKSYFLNKDINYIIDNDDKFAIKDRTNNENIYYDKKLHIFYYNYIECNTSNKIYPYSIFNLDLEYPNGSSNTINILQKQLKLLNQYLYYMNIHFTLKNKKLEEEINNLKNNMRNLLNLVLFLSTIPFLIFLFIRYNRII